MTLPLSRRVVLAGGGALAITAISGFVRRDDAVGLPAGLVPPGRNALVLHDGGAASQRFVQKLRTVAPAALFVQPVAPLHRGGFAALVHMLRRGRGAALVALMDDAEMLVLETLLRQAEAVDVRHYRHAGQALLTARL